MAQRQSLNPISERTQGMRITKPVCFQPRFPSRGCQFCGHWFTTGPQFGTQLAHGCRGHQVLSGFKKRVLDPRLTVAARHAIWIGDEKPICGKDRTISLGERIGDCALTVKGIRKARFWGTPSGARVARIHQHPPPGPLGWPHNSRRQVSSGAKSYSQ
jgi:hypothetical protein